VTRRFFLLLGLVLWQLGTTALASDCEPGCRLPDGRCASRQEAEKCSAPPKRRANQAAKAAQPKSAQTPAPSSAAKDKPAPLKKKAEPQGQKAPTK
jgi:hypothetical protein